MRKLISILFLLIIAHCVWAQNKPVSDVFSNRRNAVYYELFGNGLWAGSINYDRFLSINQNSGIILRGGLSWYEKAFPLAEVNYLTGNKKHHFETGLGYTAFQEGGLVFFRAGYRFHGNEGLLIRVAPIYTPTENFIWFGISIGYSF